MSRRQIDPVSHFFLPFSFHALYHYLCFFPVLTNGPLAQLRGVFWEELLKPLWGAGWRSSAWEEQTCSKTRAGPALLLMVQMSTLGRVPIRPFQKHWRRVVSGVLGSLLPPWKGLYDPFWPFLLKKITKNLF